MRPITDDERRRRLVRRHLFAPSTRVDDVATVADSLVALHSSDPTSVFLSACLRMRNGSVHDVERALYVDRTLIRFHSMRRTIWAMTPDVARAANAGFTRKIAASERSRTAKLFGHDDAWIADAVERVSAAVEAADGPIGTRDIATVVPDLAEQVTINVGKRYRGTMSPHTRALLVAAMEGRIVRARPAGTWIGSQYHWVANDDWLAIDWSEPDELTGATAIIGRWLDRFGPGTLDDVVWWTGSTKTLVRRALGELDAESVVVDDGAQGFVLPGDTDETPEAERSVSLLPGLDPSAMGWKLRAWYLDPEIAGRVTDRNGNIGPTVWADGRVVGGWAQRRDGTIAHDAAGLDPAQLRLLDVEVERLRSIVGATRFSPRFPAPNQRDLLA